MRMLINEEKLQKEIIVFSTNMKKISDREIIS